MYMKWKNYNFQLLNDFNELSAGARGLRPLLRFEPPARTSPPIESTKCYFMAKYNVKLVGCGMGMDFAQTWLRQMSHVTTSTSVECGSQTDVRRCSAIMGGAIGGWGVGWPWPLQ